MKGFLSLRKTRVFVIIALFVFSFSFSFSFVFADSSGEQRTFYIDSGYDAFSRHKILAVLVYESQQAYFYIDNDFWSDLNVWEKEEIISSLKDLGQEFDNKIYPQSRDLFGSEWRPGIDKDVKITVLFHPMTKNASGYFREQDEYLKEQIPTSNQREMVYLNSNLIESKLINALLAHEFAHLIQFNQKNRAFGVSEERWLLEARCEAIAFLLGYDQYLKQRKNIFINQPIDSLIEWKNTLADYGTVSLFVMYLIDHYGKEILVDSLHSSETGIESLNISLEKHGFEKKIEDIFYDWLITVLVNDCSLGEKYCYLHQDLKTIKIIPQINFLPVASESVLSVFQKVKPWAGNWQKIVGGKGGLSLSFTGKPEHQLRVSYLLCGQNNQCQLKPLSLNQEGEASIKITGFNNGYDSLVLIIFSDQFPENESDFPFYDFSFRVSFKAETGSQSSSSSESEPIAIQDWCSGFKGFFYNLRLGMRGKEVYCLQTILKKEGPEIYPEGLITGYFGPLTFKAVIRFQERYYEEILKPWNINYGTGFVGPTTRGKLNKILSLLNS